MPFPDSIYSTIFGIATCIGLSVVMILGFVWVILKERGRKTSLIWSVKKYWK